MAETLTDIYDRLRKIRRPKRPVRIAAVVALVVALAGCSTGQAESVGRAPDGWQWTNVSYLMESCTSHGDRVYAYYSTGALAVVAGGCKS